MNSLYKSISISETDNLTIENFWKKCYNFYPDSTERFYRYFDTIGDLRWNEMSFSAQSDCIFSFFNSLNLSLTTSSSFTNKQDILIFICDLFEKAEKLLN